MSWQIYLNYDEDSLTTFANAGLIRRAKKSLDDVQPQTHDAQLHFVVEDCHVELPVQGITQASCTCPAQGCCKHILSSILWLQQHPEHLQPRISNTDKNPQDHAPVIPSALDTTLQLDSIQLLKNLRKTERQLAYQIFSEWQHDPTLCQIEIQAEKISFQTTLSASAIVYFPQSHLAGMLSDVADKQKNACHLACIAYLFAHHAPEKWQWSDDLQQQNFNPVEASIGLNHDDLTFIKDIKILCLSLMRQGLSHIARESVLSLHLLNMQARAQNLPRLASELRHLHGLLQRLLTHDVQVDEAQIFDALAFLYAYLTALQHDAEQPETLNQDKFNQFRGQVQRDYVQQQIEHLIPLGCEWWTTVSGARGLTVCFWDNSTQRIREVTQARANHLDITFNQDSAAQAGIWGSSLDFLLKHQLKLTEAKISPDGKLSASADSRFQSLGSIDQLSADAFKQQVIGIDDWQQLKILLQPSSSLFNSLPRYQLLHIQACSQQELNEIEQCFECWVTDCQLQQLQLSLPIDPNHHGKINKLQYLIQTGQIIAILVRMEIQAQTIRFLPCSLVLNETKGLRIFSLDYDHLPYHKQKQNFLQQFTGRISSLLARKHELHSTTTTNVIHLTLQHTQNLLEFYANTGRQSFDPDDQQHLQQLAQQFEDLGLQLLVQLLRQQSLAFSEQLLIWRHALGLTQKLLIQPPIR
ncbi:MAG: hypothetical protein LKF82_11710 [Acinetobacter populi]|jgi:hypothetical protein|uniref:hypothetical protein n=1 Tax=Acinetobacter populi TaxID=1582270 RepID=UPI0023525CBF|nr:hypothetical protein [Acinetobacter populi]MCH4248478.1 hypothetical protein [Acinetobacter populi]